MCGMKLLYKFPNFNGCTVDVREWISNFINIIHRMMYLYQGEGHARLVPLPAAIPSSDETSDRGPVLRGTQYEPALLFLHYADVIMGMIASQITSLTIGYSIVYADQRKHQSSASLAFVRGIHRGPVNSPHKWPVTRKMFPFDDVIMIF